MEAAAPLVVVDDASGGFSMDPAGVELLRSLEGDVHVVAIGGAQRTGKSYLLSLLTESDGFAVGNTQRACTVGIWVLVTTVGEKTTAWLDTEGFASTSRSASYDAKIFALALLLSSCFIYNSRGTIDSTAIADLSLVCELTKTIHVASHGAEETGVQFAEYFPSFLWVVRDFTLAIVDPKTQRPRTAKWCVALPRASLRSRLACSRACGRRTPPFLLLSFNSSFPRRIAGTSTTRGRRRKGKGRGRATWYAVRCAPSSRRRTARRALRRSWTSRSCSAWRRSR
jgi:hypothetical protein